MSPEDKQKSMMDKVMSLLAKAESTQYPEEAEACVSKAQELMARYAIDEAMLASTTKSTRDTITHTTIVVEAPYSEAKSNLAFAIATNNDCKAVYWGNAKRRYIEVTGYSSDLEMVKILMASLSIQSVTAMLANDKNKPGMDVWGRKVHGKTWRNSFLMGYAAQIGRRLAEARSVAKTEAGNEYGTVGMGLVLRDKAVAVNSEFERKHPRTRTKQVNSSINSAAYGNGRAAANSANLSQRAAGTGFGGAIGR